MPDVLPVLVSAVVAFVLSGAAIHAGDWLLKLLAVAAIVGAWR